MGTGVETEPRRRILIVKLSSLGDVFHALPTVHALRTGLNADIDWVVQSEYAELVACFDDVDGVIPFHRRAFRSEWKTFRSRLREHEYDYVIDLQGLLKSALVAGLARARLRIGPSFHREGAFLFYSAVAGKRNRSRHAVVQNLDVLNFLGIDPGTPTFPVTFPDHGLPQSHPRIGLVPSSRWPSKNWPARCFIDLGTRLRKSCGASLFLAGGPQDVDVCAGIAAELGDVENLAGRTSLVELGSTLRELDLLIANDSGPVHMAAAVGTPTLVMFGPTDPARTGPFGSGHRVLQVNESCGPCYSRTCRREGVPCLAGITPERVEAAALEMLNPRSAA